MAAGLVGATALPVAASVRPPTFPLEAGPFYPQRQDWPQQVDADLVTLGEGSESAIGQVIHLTGQVVGGDGSARAATLVEIWQADAQGKYNHPEDQNPTILDPYFQGYGRCIADSDGRFHFRSIRPGAYPIDAFTTRAPHIHIKATPSSGQSVATQVFFAGETLNDQDEVVLGLTDPQKENLVLKFNAAPEIEKGAFVAHFNFVVS